MMQCLGNPTIVSLRRTCLRHAVDIVPSLLDSAATVSPLSLLLHILSWPSLHNVFADYVYNVFKVLERCPLLY